MKTITLSVPTTKVEAKAAARAAVAVVTREARVLRCVAKVAWVTFRSLDRNRV